MTSKNSVSVSPDPISGSGTNGSPLGPNSVLIVSRAKRRQRAPALIDHHQSLDHNAERGVVRVRTTIS